MFMEYCLSDIHGCYSLFCRLLEKLKFGGGDTLYVLGDIIDKGPESVRPLRLLCGKADEWIKRCVSRKTYTETVIIGVEV